MGEGGAKCYFEYRGLYSISEDIWADSLLCLRREEPPPSLLRNIQAGDMPEKE